MKIMSLIMLSIFLVCCSCSKDSPTESPAPSNLVFNYQVATDKSGTVNFSATAENAVQYEFDLGNGKFENSSTGTLTYKYASSGNYAVKVTAKNSSGKVLSKTINVEVIVTLTLVWSDEFNTGSQPDATKWKYDIGTGSGGWGNNEVQYYTNRPENAYISNGTLKIVAKKENYSGSTFTSARLLTQDKFTFKYGKVEMSAKLPVGVGTWPAFWMLGKNITTAGWPASGEIDIMEHLGRDLNTIFSTLHYPGHSGGNSVGKTIKISNATTEFHTYTADWSAENIKFYVDNNLFYTFPNAPTLPFNQDFFVLLNMAIGGNFGGAVDPGLTQAVYEIDYVRIYQ